LGRLFYQLWLDQFDFHTQPDARIRRVGSPINEDRAHAQKQSPPIESAVGFLISTLINSRIYF
jgi:hypothetical protein